MTRRPIFFDLETTGRDSSRDRIVEIAAYDRERNLSFERLVHPGGAIPQEVSAIHGITDDMVRDAPRFAGVVQEFIEFCSGPVMLVAHNGDLFDLPFLKREFQMAKAVFPEEWIFVDSLKWARKYRKDLPRHALQYLREFFGLPSNQAHRALDDVMTLMRVFSLMTDDLTCEEIIERVGGICPAELFQQTPKESVLELF